MTDVVNHPPHYGGDTTYEAIKVIEAWELGFCLGNAVKYISRAGKKDPNAELEDLRKAAWYVQREIERLEPQRIVLCEACGWVGKAGQVVDGKCPRACGTPLKYFLDPAAVR